MDPLLTRQEVAALLRTDVWEVGRWIRRGELVEVRLGTRSSRIAPDDLAAFIKARRTA